MKLEVLNTSVVISAKHHNPTILHPSFLASQSIVGPDWETVEPPVCTPVFAIVKYKNGIVFNVEENKFQVIESQPGDDVGKSRISILAYKYAEKLPHVKYRAVGINFKGFIECEAPKEILTRHFLKSEAANFLGNEPEAVGLRFVYALADARLRISFDVGNVTRTNEEKKRKGIIADANYHTDLKGENIIQEIKETTSLFSKRTESFIELVHDMLKLES